MKELHRNGVIHVTAGARMGRKNEGDGRGFVLARRVARLNASGAAWQNQFGQVDPFRWARGP
jgi:hypothetical protein